MLRRLYLQIYLGFLGVCLLMAVVAMCVGWYLRTRPEQMHPAIAGLVQMFADTLPPPDASREEVRSGLQAQAERLGLHATLWDRTGGQIARVGPALPAPALDADDVSFFHTRRGPPGVGMRLADGRWLAVALRPHSHLDEAGWIFGLALFAGVIAIGSYPIARRVARRLESLRAGVEQLGAGDLSVRVPVQGHDEVAALAHSFNRAADRIERLVGSQRRMLASASHELRSPLARLRVAIEMMGSSTRPELREEAETNIKELDDLIEDLLLATRLESADRATLREPVELLALLTEEAARVAAEVSGEPLTLLGDARSLCRMLRNLLENARRHGNGSEIHASLTPLPASEGEIAVRIRVSDRGPGVPESERERIFEPFYRPVGHSEGRDGGVGLGLALVREIASHHGGSVRCLANPGGGTVFEVDLRTAS